MKHCSPSCHSSNCNTSNSCSSYNFNNNNNNNSLANNSNNNNCHSRAQRYRRRLGYPLQCSCRDASTIMHLYICISPYQVGFLKN